MYRIFYFTAVFLLLPFLIYSKEKKDSIKTYVTPSITVTTTRAVEKESPVPFAEITESDIKETYTLTDIPQFMNSMPSMLVYSQSGNGIGYTNLMMRGFGQRRISVMINGIPQNDPEDHNVYWIDFPDLAESLESIQVQRGAGLSTYGSAAIGGTINMVTSNFVNRRSIRLSSGVGWQDYGSGNTYQPTMSKQLAEFSSGMVDNYAFYGRLSRIKSDGYRDRSWANLNSFFFSAIRFDEKLTTQINIFGGPLNDGLVYNGLPKAYIKDLKLRRKNFAYGGWAYDSTGKNVAWAVDRRPQEKEHFSQPHYELLNDWTISDDLSFKSAVFYYTGEGYFDVDDSYAGAAQFRLTPENGFEHAADPRNAISRAYVGNKQGGWIPRFIWTFGKSTLTTGAEIRIHRSNHWGKINYAENLPDNYDPDYKFYSYDGVRNIFSFFFAEKYDLSDKFTLNVDAQLVHHTYAIENEKAGNIYTSYNTIDGKTISGKDRIFNVNYLFFNPRVGAIYRMDEIQSIFSSVALTSREPRMSNLYDASYAYWGSWPSFEADTAGGIIKFDFDKPLVKPEQMFDFELGWVFSDGKNHASVNAYFMDYSDELVKSGQLDHFGEPVDGNAPETRHYGIELQAGREIFSGKTGKLILTANLTYSKNKIVKYNYVLNNGELLSLTDNDIAGFPDLLGGVNLVYKYSGLFVGISAKFVDKYRTDNFGGLLKTDQRLITQMRNDWEGYYYDNTLDAYTIFNLDASYSLKDILGAQSLRFRMRINNLLNKLYSAGAEGKEFFPGAERNIYFAVDLEL